MPTNTRERQCSSLLLRLLPYMKKRLQFLESWAGGAGAALAWKNAEFWREIEELRSLIAEAEELTVPREARGI